MTKDTAQSKRKFIQTVVVIISPITQGGGHTHTHTTMMCTVSASGVIKIHTHTKAWPAISSEEIKYFCFSFPLFPILRKRYIHTYTKTAQAMTRPQTHTFSAKQSRPFSLKRERATKLFLEFSTLSQPAFEGVGWKMTHN